MWWWYLFLVQCIHLSQALQFSKTSENLIEDNGILFKQLLSYDPQADVLKLEDPEYADNLASVSIFDKKQNLSVVFTPKKNICEIDVLPENFVPEHLMNISLVRQSEKIFYSVGNTETIYNLNMNTPLTIPELEQLPSYIQEMCKESEVTRVRKIPVSKEDFYNETKLHIFPNQKQNDHVRVKRQFLPICRLAYLCLSKANQTRRRTWFFVRLSDILTYSPVWFSSLSCITCCEDTGGNKFSVARGFCKCDRIRTEEQIRQCSPPGRRESLRISRTNLPAIIRGPPWNPISLCRCGEARRDRARPLVFGGSDSEQSDFPWQVRLTDGHKSCGGSLLSSLTVMTAAHCANEDMRPSQWTAVLGEHDLSRFSRHEQRIQISQWLNHPLFTNYTRPRFDYDFAILTLERPVEFTENISPICLPTEYNYSDREALITGWGLTSNGGRTSNILQHGNVRTISNYHCRFHTAHYPDDITNNMICVTGNGTAACKGDSGGAVVTKKRNRNYYEQIGVVSWARTCGEPGVPGVNARVTAAMSWIERNTLGKKCLPP